MSKTSSAPVHSTTEAETFEFLIGLTEQRCMVLHPTGMHAGFVNEDELADEHQTQSDRSESRSLQRSEDARRA